MDLVNTVDKDKQDGDVDIDVKIAPNTLYARINAFFRQLVSGKGTYILERGLIRQATDEEAGQLKNKNIGEQINPDVRFIAGQAEYNLLKGNRLLETAVARNSDIQKLYINSKNQLAFLLDLKNALNLEENDKQIQIADEFRKSGEKTVQLLLKEYKNIQGIKDEIGKREASQPTLNSISQDDYERIKRALDKMPEFADRNKRGKITNNIQPALAIAYHPKSGKYELGINKSGDANNAAVLNKNLKKVIDSIQSNFRKVIEEYGEDATDKDIREYLNSVLGRDTIGGHAEVKAVSNLLNIIMANKSTKEIENFNMQEIFVAVIKTQEKGKLGYEFIRCPNCTLVLNGLGIRPLTDNSDFLKDGIPVIK